MSKKPKTGTEDIPPPLKNSRFISSSSGKEREKIRKKRLAEALRENLRKRKEQTRGRIESSDKKK